MEFPINSYVVYKFQQFPEEVGIIKGYFSLPYQTNPDIYYVSFPLNPPFRTTIDYQQIHRMYLRKRWEGDTELEYQSQYTCPTIQATTHHGILQLPENSVCGIMHFPFKDGQEIIQLLDNNNFIFDKDTLTTFWNYRRIHNFPPVNPLTNLVISNQSQIKQYTVKLI